MEQHTFRPTLIPGLRSPYDKVGGLVYFARMISKIRLQAANQLPEAYQVRLGGGADGMGFDGRCVRLLGVDFDRLTAEVLKEDNTDEALLEWCFENGRRPSQEEIRIWSDFLVKRGWRDEASELLAQRIREAGLPADSDMETIFDFIEVDEGRPARSKRSGGGKG